VPFVEARQAADQCRATRDRSDEVQSLPPCSSALHIRTAVRVRAHQHVVHGLDHEKRQRDCAARSMAAATQSRVPLVRQATMPARKPSTAVPPWSTRHLLGGRGRVPEDEPGEIGCERVRRVDQGLSVEGSRCGQCILRGRPRRGEDDDLARGHDVPDGRRPGPTAHRSNDLLNLGVVQTPKTISCPAAAHPRPKALPTLPAPMLAIFMVVILQVPF
jgi:hypothetical protein